MSRPRQRRIVKVRVPEQQPPFFEISGNVFVSLLWHWGDPLTVAVDELIALLSSTKAGSVIIGRRLTAAEERRFRDGRRTADCETMAFTVPNDRVRWRPGRRR